MKHSVKDSKARLNWNTLPSNDPSVIDRLQDIVTDIVLDVRQELREYYHDPMIEPSSPNYRFTGLCDVASEMIIDRLKSINGYGSNFTVRIVHGEQKHSVRIRSCLWPIEHSWVEIEIVGQRRKLYVDATCEQFHRLYPGIPSFYVGVEPPAWFLADRDNLYISWPRSNWLARKTKAFVRWIEYDLHGRLSDIVRRWLNRITSSI